MRCLLFSCSAEVGKDSHQRGSLFCRYHLQHKARHGSHWHPTYRAADLKPYLTAAPDWLKVHRMNDAAFFAVRAVDELLVTSGRAEPAMNLRRVSASRRARIAFARLRQAGVTAERLAAIHLAVSALIADDLGSHRTREFRIVQVAKAAHRLASGTHRRWDAFDVQGRPMPIELHAYPRSSGLVLRKIGEAIAKACRLIPESAVTEVIMAKVERFGLHPSRLPGWRPSWDTGPAHLLQKSLAHT